MCPARHTIPRHNESYDLLRAADVPPGRLRDLNRLFIDSRVGILPMQMILLGVLDVPGMLVPGPRNRSP